MEFRRYVEGDMEKIWRKDLIEELGFTTTYCVDIDLTWTAFINEEIIGLGGFRKYWQGVYECWIMVKSPEAFYNYKIEVIKFIKRQFDSLEAHRLQATSLVENQKDARLLQFLGFELEGVLNKYGPDRQDYLMWALVE